MNEWSNKHKNEYDQMFGLGTKGLETLRDQKLTKKAGYSEA